MPTIIPQYVRGGHWLGLHFSQALFIQFLFELEPLPLSLLPKLADLLIESPSVGFRLSCH